MTNELLIKRLQELKFHRDRHDALWQAQRNAEEACKQNTSKMDAIETEIAQYLLNRKESLIVQIGDVAAYLPQPAVGYTNPKCAVQFITPIVQPKD